MPLSRFRFALAVLLVLALMPSFEVSAASSSARSVHSTIRGTLSVYHIDKVGGAGEERYTIEDGAHHIYDLHTVKPLRAKSGSVVEADGLIQGTTLDSGNVQVVSTTSTTAQKDERTLVMLVNFSDDAVEPFTPTDVQSMAFTGQDSVNSYYAEDSFGQTVFSGDVDPHWITLPYSASTVCNNYFTVEADAESAATADGYNPTTYYHKLVLMPFIQECGWTGVGSIGGSRAWVMARDYLTTVEAMVHELGHNLGLYHASTLDCGTKSVDAYANCITSEYGDSFDPMGSPNLFHSNAAHKEEAGWLTADNIRTADTEGSYTLAPIETASTSTQELKMAKPDTFETYSIEYRQPTGRDAALPPAMTGGVSIRTSGAGNTYLIDGTPGDSTFLNAALTDGMTFSDPINSIYITQVSHDASGATVILSHSPSVLPSPCTRAAPMVYVSPSDQTGLAGQSLSYTVTVIDNDSALCSSSDFSLSAVSPAGWSASYDRTTVTVPAGGSATAALTVAAPTNAGSGSFAFTSTATNSQDATYSSSAQGSFTIAPVCTLANPSISLSPSSQTGAKGQTLTYTISITDNDSSACGTGNFSLASTVPAGWSANIQGTSMNIFPGTTGTTALEVTSPSSAANATYTIGIQTANTANSLYASSASATYTVFTPGDTTPPAVSISKPANGSKLSGTYVDIAASATDNVKVTKLEIYIDSKLVSSTTASSLTYRWSSLNKVAAGAHTITAKGYDAAGNIGTKSITVYK